MQFFGRVTGVDSSEYQLDITVSLTNVSGNEIKLPATMYGTPDKIGIKINSVSTVE